MGRHEQPVRRLRDPWGEVVKRWIVNARTREVRPSTDGPCDPKVGEWFYDAVTSADAIMAGQRRLLAEEALETLDLETTAKMQPLFMILADRIEWNRLDTTDALGALAELHNTLEARGFEVWREGLALLVLARRARGTEGIHAWVSEIGSNR